MTSKDTECCDACRCPDDCDQPGQHCRFIKNGKPNCPCHTKSEDVKSIVRSFGDEFHQDMWNYEMAEELIEPWLRTTLTNFERRIREEVLREATVSGAEHVATVEMSVSEVQKKYRREGASEALRESLERIKSSKVKYEGATTLPKSVEDVVELIVENCKESFSMILESQLSHYSDNSK